MEFLSIFLSEWLLTTIIVLHLIRFNLIGINFHWSKEYQLMLQSKESI